MRNGDRSTEATLDWLQAFVMRRSVTAQQARLLSLAVLEGRRQAALLPAGITAAELPLAVCLAAGGSGPPPLSLAAACLCVYLGADLLDNVADRELAEIWSNAGPDQAVLVGIGLLAPLAMAALSELNVAARMLRGLQAALVDGLVTMGAGQLEDLALSGRDDIGLDACEAMVLAKSGAEWSMFARIGALAAGAPPAICEAYAEFGRELGTTGQLVSDCADLVDGGAGRDLATRKRTLPIVHALTVLTSGARAELLSLLDAPHIHDRDAVVRQMLLDAGSFHFTALVAEVHRQRAIGALRSAAPTGSAASVLYDLVEDFAVGRGASQDKTVVV